MNMEIDFFNSSDILELDDVGFERKARERQVLLMISQFCKCFFLSTIDYTVL